MIVYRSLVRNEVLTQASRTPIVVTAILLLACWPAPGRSQDAKGAKRSYVVEGRRAWEAARQAGFEFFPAIPDGRFLLAGQRDGVDTTLKSCTAPQAPCVPEARVLGGEMIVLVTACESACTRAHRFEMFAGRRLAPGWRLTHVELAGAQGTWARAPRYDTDDPSFALLLAVSGAEPAVAMVERITLSGPPGADWREAFAR